MHNPTHALKSVKGPGNTFDIDSAPQARSRVSNINFVISILGKGYKYPIKIVEGRQSSFPLRV
jgi:hypothetical protein